MDRVGIANRCLLPGPLVDQTKLEDMTVDDFDQTTYKDDTNEVDTGCEHGIENCVYCSGSPVVWVVDYPGGDISKSKAFLDEERAVAEYVEKGVKIWCYKLDTDS